MITTWAWVLRQGSAGGSALEIGDFRIERCSFPDLEAEELLVEPLFGG
jgi:hypothetical protein